MTLGSNGGFLKAFCEDLYSLRRVRGHPLG